MPLAIVTGTSRGLGRALAERLLAEGHAARYNFEPGKAGSTISYATLQRESPDLVALFHAAAAAVSDLLAVPVVPTPASVSSSMSTAWGTLPSATVTPPTPASMAERQASALGIIPPLMTPLAIQARS